MKFNVPVNLCSPIKPLVIIHQKPIKKIHWRQDDGTGSVKMLTLFPGFGLQKYAIPAEIYW